MKTILVLTDFSKNANAAAEAALTLSGKLGADLLLFNTYINYETMPFAGGGAWIVDEITDRHRDSKRGLATLMEGLESLTDQLDPEDRKPVIYSQSDDSDLGLDVADMIDQKNVELVVMGARSDSPDDFMFGMDTNSILENSSRPVLIVPQKTDLKKVRKLIFATDFDETDIKVIHYLAKLGKLFHYQIEIVHVTEPGKKETANKVYEIAFKETVTRLSYQGLTFSEVSGAHVAAKLKRICFETGSGLLVMLHQQHPFFVRIFEHSETKEVLVNQKIPLLVFPSKMK